MNTTFIPYDRTINTVSYYQRRKRELKRHPTNEVVINLTKRNAERKDLKNQFEKYDGIYSKQDLHYSKFFSFRLSVAKTIEA